MLDRSVISSRILTMFTFKLTTDHSTLRLSWLLSPSASRMAKHSVTSIQLSYWSRSRAPCDDTRFHYNYYMKAEIPLRDKRFLPHANSDFLNIIRLPSQNIGGQYLNLIVQMYFSSGNCQLCSRKNKQAGFIGVTNLVQGPFFSRVNGRYLCNTCAITGLLQTVVTK